MAQVESLFLIPCLTSGGFWVEGGRHKNVVLLLGIGLWFKLRQPGELSEDTVGYCRVVERSGDLGPVISKTASFLSQDSRRQTSIPGFIP